MIQVLTITYSCATAHDLHMIPYYPTM